MNKIEEWFSGNLDYYQGVIIYSGLPEHSSRTLRQLQKGKSQRNMSQLISELRKAKNSNIGTLPVKKTIPPTVSRVKEPEDMSMEIQRKVISQESAKKEFDGLRMGDLPQELRPKFSRARALFHEMIELKFMLNDLDDDLRDEALGLMLQIEDRDQERDLLWEELNHWKKFKKLLPQPNDVLDGQTPHQLYLKKRSATSSITKISNRIQEKVIALEKETNGHKRLILKSAINRSWETIHKHRVLINRINKLL